MEGAGRLCSRAQLPAPGELRQFAHPRAAGKVVCVSNVNGTLAAVDNECPHRGGPLAEGSLEGGKVMCPWHAWAFDLKTGVCDHDPGYRVAVYTIEVSGPDVLIAE